MSEQQREPAEAATSSPQTTQEADQLQSVPPAGGIHAETIMQTTNVVSGTQHIGTQINYGTNGSTHKRIPLQRPRRAEHFVDREAELTRLLADLKAGRVVTVCGLSGMGKTALVAEALWALALADAPPDAFPDGILFYSFYGQAAVTVALEQLVYTLGEDPVSTPALAAQRALSGQRLLLVLDGVEEADHLEQVLSICGACAVLMTTRRRADAPDPFYRLDLQPLPEQEAVSVVQAFGGKQAADSTATSGICERVGNLPLALRLVGRYLAEQEEEASEYLTWLQRTPLAALDQGSSRQESVPVLLARSIARLSATAQQAQRLVGLLALAPFDRNLIAQTLELAEEDARRALGELVNYGLLVRQQSGYEASHPLIHTYAREELFAGADPIAQHAILERVVRVLLEQFPEVEYATWRRCGELLPHVQVCAALNAQQGEPMLEMASLLNGAGWYLRETGRYAQAELLLQQGLRLYDQIGDARAAGLGSILGNLTLLYQAQGRYAQAIEYAQRGLDFDEQVCGPDDPSTSASLDNLALLYTVQGRYGEAEPLYLRALTICEKALPPDHPDTAATLENYTTLLRKMNRPQEAQTLEQRAKAIRARRPSQSTT